ncbi:MAG: carbon-nitrogen hydrolase family protein [Thermodesulfobacteriota bacterium]|nr:carbon-nitrogen hydrolase family protein [Thermodesulfobacteriota bacterium]
MANKPKRVKKVCIVQINYNSENIQRHVERIKDIINKLKSYDLIVFPELILHGHPSFEKPEGFLYRKMKVMYSAISNDLYQFIRNEEARVIIGEVKRWGERYFNIATYIDKYLTQSYTKTHVHWTENFIPGRELKVFDSPFGKIGITICFDAAFSEVWRVLSLKGADVVVNISAVPETFPVDYMWRRFEGAAIYNQVFVVYANRPGPFFSGHSAVFNPQGDILVRSGSEETIIEADINLNEIQRWRNEEQIYPNRRPLLYREIVNRHRSELVALQAETIDPKLAIAN